MQIPAARILQPPNREDVLPHLPLGQPSGRRSDSPSDGVADSPSGGPSKLGRSLGQPFGRTLETRTVTRIALREDPRNSDSHSDSPSGGTLELRPKLRSLYRVAHIRCHLSGRASPSRTSSCRNPDSLSALRNYFAGREREARNVYGMCMRARMRFGQPPHLLFIGKPRGSVPPQITKNPHAKGFT